MTSGEMYGAIQRETPPDQQQVLFELLGLIQTASTAIIELAGREKLRTGSDPLMLRSRSRLEEFLELRKEDC